MRTRRLIGLGALITLASGPVAGELQQRSQVPQRKALPVPSAKAMQTPHETLDQMPIVSETSSSLFVVGDAIAPTLDQARQNSRENAVVRTAGEVSRRVFADPNAQLSTISFDTLRDYVRRVTRDAGTQSVPM